MEDYRELNRASWDERAPAHAASPDYAVQRLREDPAHLSDVVRFDLPRLGDIAGLRGVHLQCHIGTDTLSLARLGARMSGLDFSAASLRQATLLAQSAGADIDYHHADVYDAPDVLGRGVFDLVYTGVGALIWLPSIDRWAQAVAELLAPGGRLFLRDGHPMLFALADIGADGVLVLEHPYFEVEQPLVWDQPGTYVETGVEFQHTRTHEWNHGIGEIATALLEHGLQITALVEHDSVPWEAFPGHMERIEDNEWRIRERPLRLAHSFTLQAVMPGG